MSEGIEGSVKLIIDLLSEEGMTMVMDEETKSSEPASSLQISFMIWKHFAPRIFSSYSDNEIRQLAYSKIPEVRRFIGDLAVLQVRQKLSAPPLEPGQALVLNAKIQKILAGLRES